MNEGYATVGGDFNRIFDHDDYLTMFNIPDEATCILRGHLILEEVLNLWSSKITKTEDLYAGAFVPFKTKLVVCKNLGMADELFSVMDKVNEVRNRFSHRKGYRLEDSVIESLKTRTNRAVESAKIQNCEIFQLFSSGKNRTGETVEEVRTWNDSDNRHKFLITFVVFMLKVTHWIQNEFNGRGIEYTIVSINNS